MDIKAAYRRFRQWQLDPFEYRAHSQDTVKLLIRMLTNTDA